jgi:mono/diheme cytochrome c family protein
MTTKTRILISLYCLAILNGCSSEKEKPVTGKELYEYYCAGCHGESGAGQFLRAIPPLIQNKMLRKAPLQPSQIRHKIQGGPSPKRKMPSFANITDHEANLIALYIQKLSR